MTTYNLICTNCNKPFSRYWDTKSKNKFCCIPCAATHNNRKSPKRKPLQKNLCKNCGSYGRNRKHGHCSKCRQASTAIQLGENKYLSDEHTAKNSWHKFQNIRNHAHRMAEGVYRLEKECAICKYSTYVELCHIKPIYKFQPTSTWNEINSSNNIIYLCPTHHKELDLGILVLPLTL